MRGTLLKLVGVGLVAGALCGLAMTNPSMSQYQTEILKPAAQKNAGASDTMLASILSTLPVGAASESAATSDVVQLLTNRTARQDYVVFSVYDTAFEFCPGSGVARAVTRTIGVAGRFHTWSKGACMTQEADGR